MAAEKRPASDDYSSSQLVVKRPNLGSSLPSRGANNGALIQGAARTTGLQAPLMELSGHSGEIFVARFDPTGNFIASGSMDRNIMLWRTYGDCENYGLLSGHRGAVNDLQWARDSKILFTASADMHLASWDVDAGARIRRYVGHEDMINAVDLSRRGEEMLYSASDDGSVGIWDARTRTAVDYLQSELPVTAVAISEAGNELYAGGIDNVISVWDVRKRAVVYAMSGHHDTIASLELSPDAQTLLSYSFDSTARTWDVRPFAPADRHVRTFDGATMGVEKNLVRACWNPSGKQIAVGAGDGTVVVWADNGKLLYKLPGHKGAVNCTDFAPNNEPILLSASSDRRILLGELR